MSKYQALIDARDQTEAEGWSLMIVPTKDFSALLADLERAEKDAERYRWLRNESWAGYNQSKRLPEVAESVVLTRDGAGNVKTILAEEAMDAAIDAALAQMAGG